jgi:histidyl-tRNA synthetase
VRSDAVLKYRRPKGTADTLPQQAAEWVLVESTFREICARFGYGEIRTPMFEQTELFVRSVGETTDIVGKEMYTFEDRSGRSLTLRPEGTAGTVRAYLENNLMGQADGHVAKLFYIAPAFRYERPQAGRLRQHHQAGLEAIGSLDPAMDAEVIDLFLAFFRELGLTECSLMLNSVGCPVCRPRHREALRNRLRPVLPQLCGDCQARFETNPLRILDCKVPQCRELTADAPASADYLCEECREHFGKLQEYLAALGAPFELNPHLVRGLDYYTKTAFEVVHTGLGSQDAICGGGRYDGLVEQCGGRPTPAVGAAAGIERLLLSRGHLGLVPQERDGGRVFVATLGEKARLEGLRLLAQLRAAGIRADTDFAARSLKAQMRRADKEGFTRVLILGEDEIARGMVTVRTLATGEQEEAALSQVVQKLV